MRNLDHRQYRRILIIKPSSFGDVIHALPVLNGLRTRFPDARICWLVSTSCAGLLEGHPALDEVIPFDRKRYGLIGRSLGVTIEFARFLCELHGRRFDLVLDLQGLFRSGFLSLASGARTRVGFAAAREFAWVFYTHRVPVDDPDVHAVDRYYLLGRLLGFADVPITFDLPVSPAARAAVVQMLATGGIGAGEPYALMAPGTRWETKRWPAEHFAAVARQIQSRHQLPVVLIGAADEVPIADRVANLAGGRIVNLAGRTALPELIALVAGAALAVTNDSGPLHLATALGTPMVAVYGPTSPQRTGPYRQPQAVARLDLPCSPCYLKRLADCPYHHRCMRELPPEVISARISQVLEPGTRAP